MEVHFQCTIQICRHRCPEQCSRNGNSANDQHFVVNGKIENQRVREPINGDLASSASDQSAGELLSESSSGQQMKARLEKRDISKQSLDNSFPIESKEIGLSRVLNVVSKGDLAFTFNQTSYNEFGDDFSLFSNNDEIVEGTDEQQFSAQQSIEQRGMICLSHVYFFGILMTIVFTLLITCCGCSFLFLKHRTALRNYRAKNKFGCSSSISSSDLYSVPPQYDYRTEYRNYQHK